MMTVERHREMSRVRRQATAVAVAVAAWASSSESIIWERLTLSCRAREGVADSVPSPSAVLEPAAVTTLVA